MRASKMYMPTLRQVPAEAEIASHRLMLRAGLMRKLASGIYSLLPLGLRVFRKVERIVREEMDASGAIELLMPAILPAEVYQESGRWDVFGPEMFRLKDRSNRDFCLGPTHEEVFTMAVRDEVKSYKSLPINLYQIQTKYRDEIRPRFGVMRCREFVMKDAYSFDRDEKGLDRSYQAMKKAYCAVFDRCGLEYMIVQADSGAMGGSGSEEFMVRSNIGEAVVVYCKSCGYAANEEKAEVRKVEGKNESATEDEAMPKTEKVHTPDVRTIADLQDFFGCDASRFGKTLLYMADGQPVAVVIRGDRELNETKLKNRLSCSELNPATDEQIQKATSAETGFAGPIGLKATLWVDHEITNLKNMITGANETGYHLTHVNFGRDFTTDRIADLRNITKDDPCPMCGNPIEISRGIEVGHIFKLGRKYAESLDCTYLDESGKANPMVMGSYGIGVGRTLASIIEQNFDDDGIIWPVSVAPYHVIIVTVKTDDETQMALSEKLYKNLLQQGVETLWDERKERPGVKFKDADLIGIPIRITVGKKADADQVEYKLRSEKDIVEMNSDEAIQAASKTVFGCERT